MWAVGNDPRIDFRSVMARFNGMMEDFDPPPGFYDNNKIFQNRLKDGSHGTDNTFGIEKVVVSLEKTDRTSVILFGFDKIFFTTSQQVLEIREKGD